jgi:hypothetical protein
MDKTAQGISEYALKLLFNGTVPKNVYDDFQTIAQRFLPQQVIKTLVQLHHQYWHHKTKYGNDDFRTKNAFTNLFNKIEMIDRLNNNYNRNSFGYR